MRLKVWGFLLVWACGAFGSAWALSPDGYEGIPYIGGSGVYEITDSGREQKNNFGYRALVGYPFGAHSSLELSYFDARFIRKLDNRPDYASNVMLDYVYDFGLFGFHSKFLPDFKPYVLAGPGVIRDDSRGNHNYNAALDAGVGLLFPLKIGTWDWGWSLRTEARAAGEYNGHADHGFPDDRVLVDYRFEVGLNVPLTLAYPRHPAAVAVPECSTTVVDPATGRADCTGDSDGDGVKDDLDQCPGTPAGVRVDEKGCPLPVGDEDGDGVLDADDQCPHTPAGVKVDAKGCAINQTVVLEGVNFETGSAVLTGQATHVLDGVAQALTAQKDVRVEIGGHTDNVGDKSFNLVLSQQRAESVKQYLIGKGVDASRLATQGYGETQPVASNANAKGRAANRRVEFKLITQ